MYNDIHAPAMPFSRVEPFYICKKTKMIEHPFRRYNYLQFDLVSSNSRDSHPFHLSATVPYKKKKKKKKKWGKYSKTSMTRFPWMIRTRVLSPYDFFSDNQENYLGIFILF